eukprot:453225-Pyramimonas_sp.AAC.1
MVQSDTCTSSLESTTMPLVPMDLPMLLISTWRMRTSLQNCGRSTNLGKSLSKMFSTVTLVDSRMWIPFGAWMRWLLPSRLYLGRPP